MKKKDPGCKVVFVGPCISKKQEAFDSSVVDGVFKVVSKCANVTKFVVEEASLNEIFISKVQQEVQYIVVMKMDI